MNNLTLNNRVVINKEVSVPEVYFKSEGQLKSYPRRMEFGGREYTFMDGLRYLVHKGAQLVQVFDMTDGARTAPAVTVIGLFLNEMHRIRMRTRAQEVM